MLSFSIYMAYLYIMLPISKVKTLFIVQFVLNVGWNFVFFNQHLIALGLLVIIALLYIVTSLFLTYRKQTGLKSILILPYVLWLLIACSLNFYIFLYN